MQLDHAFRNQMLFASVILLLVGCLVQQQFSPTTGKIPNDPLINELLATNHTGLVDEDGDHSDWIELYNPGPQPVNLRGWSMTDDPDQPQKWPFPEINLGNQAYLLIFASGKDRRAVEPDQALHTNFKLDQHGEFLGLYNLSQGHFASTITRPAGSVFPAQFRDIAYGRSGAEDGYAYLAQPTPGQPNDAMSLGVDVVAPVRFSAERGFYDTPFRLELTTQTPDAVIRYTLDGSEPTPSTGLVYSEPLSIKTTTLVRAVAIKPDFLPTPVETHTYLFLDNIVAQSNAPLGFPTSWGAYKGAPVQADYEMDPDVIDTLPDPKILKEALQSIPTLSVVTELRHFYDLYANPRRKGKAWERPVSVEFFDPQAHQPGFQIEAGLRIQGELGRSEYMPKHAFRLFFRNEYGSAKLNYPLFASSPIEEFDTLVLRSGVNRSFAGYPKREEDLKLTTYTRDEWLRASQRAMSDFGSHGLFVHLYLNGLYWGLYNVVERPDTAFMAAYFGGEEADWQAINHAETSSHTSARFQTLHQLAAQGNLADPERYALIQTYLDVPHFIDYLILNWYAGNLDWGFNNWYAGVGPDSDPIKYFVWDGERTWYDGAEIYMELDEYNDQPNLVRPLFEALLKNPDFRIELADRMAKHLFNDGSLADEPARTRWLTINQAIEPAIIAESARWGDARFDAPLTQADWTEAHHDVLSQMEGNALKLIRLAREAGYYPLLDPPLLSQPNDLTQTGVTIKMIVPSPNRQATIYYTTDGTDPRLSVSGAVAPQAQPYTAPLRLPPDVHLKARAFDGEQWSALREGIFEGEPTE